MYDLIKNFDKIINLDKGIYNAGSENELSTYEIGETVLSNMGIGDRASEILIKDVERYKIQNRDLRISNDKLKKYNIHFNSTSKAISKCISNFSFTLKNLSWIFSSLTKCVIWYNKNNEIVGRCIICY